MNNALVLSIQELIIAFLYAIVLVCPLQWMLVFIGILSSFQIAAALKVSAVLSLANLCLVLYDIKLLDEDIDI